MTMTSQEHAQSGFARMLREGILTDITVNAVGGSIRAHRAVLATRSPVFLSMFSHNLREKELSTVDIPDMSIGACRAFVGYLYGAAPEADQFLPHRSELVAAGDKYGVASLKRACEESMREDVGAENLLERLQVAHLYRLRALKRTCLRLLVEFGKMHEIPKEFEAFMRTADHDLVAEIKQICAMFKKMEAVRVAQIKQRCRVVRKKKAVCCAPTKDMAREVVSVTKVTKHMSTPDQASGGIPAKRARRPNVRLAGREWAK